MLPYTAIYQNAAGRITRYTAQASNDKKQAWAQLSGMRESDGECLILLVPGDHPVVQYIDTAIAKAKNPFQMAESMKLAVMSGRKSFLSGRIAPNLLGSASTTKKGLI